MCVYQELRVRSDGDILSGNKHLLFDRHHHLQALVAGWQQYVMLSVDHTDTHSASVMGTQFAFALCRLPETATPLQV